ncbi:synaptic vesicle 2-related protein-like [Styela clava]|uniref:synaptic vesicle 2-related protein-like n=1 Tax=Styela clava TaxID=7725 RepID=UPI00193AC338|nr:synaptic vesicle 2-related protein-like [Styela clava]
MADDVVSLTSPDDSHDNKLTNSVNDSATYSSTDVQNTTEETFTVEEAVEAIGFGKFQWKLSIMTGFAWMADAMELMILSIISPQLRCVWMLYSWQEALITTVVFIGMMLSSSIWGNICDQFGRRTGLILCVVFTFYMGLLSAFSPNYVWILLLRGLVGFGVGGVPQSVTLYSEFLPQKSRATAIVLVEVFWAIGTCFEVLLALLVMPTLGWRWLLALSSLPLLLFSLACKWLPESARYNVLSGHPDRAIITLKEIAAQNGTTLPAGKLMCGQQEKRGRLEDLFKNAEMTKTTVLLWLIWLNCAFAYYGVVLMTTELLQQEGTENTCSSIAQKKNECNLSCHKLTSADYVDLLWTTLAEFPGLFFTLVIINFIGRKKTMALTMVGFAVFCLLLMICSSRSLMIFFLFVARAFISGGFQAAYVYTPEVYPTNVRAIGLGSCSGMARVGAIITPFVAQVLLHKSLSLAVGTYAGVSLLAMVCSLLLPIETKGRTMQDSVAVDSSSGVSRTTSTQ